MKIPHDSLHRAILHSPDDNTPRLLYADWLEDRGDLDRADFIRVQIELATPDLDPERADALHKREQELLAAHADEWKKPFTKEEKPGFTRGFVSSLRLSLDGLMRHGRRHSETSPIERVSVANVPNEELDVFTTLASRKYLSRLKTLDFYSSFLSEAAARILFASPHLTQLRTLYFAEGNTTPSMVRLLGERLQGLRELYLWDFHEGELGDGGLAQLANTAAFASLTRLDLLNNGVGVRGARAVAESPYLRQLEHLAFGVQACGYAQNRIGVAGMRALAQSPQLACLRSLAFGVTQVGNDGVRELAASPHLRRLTSLDLALIEMTCDGAIALAESPILDSVSWLNLSSNYIGDNGVTALATSAHARNVHTLWLWGNTMRSAGVRALAESPYLSKLRHLALGGNVGDTADVNILLGDNRFAQLTELNLRTAQGLNDTDRTRLKVHFGERVKL